MSQRHKLGRSPPVKKYSRVYAALIIAWMSVSKHPWTFSEAMRHTKGRLATSMISHHTHGMPILRKNRFLMEGLRKRHENRLLIMTVAREIRRRGEDLSALDTPRKGGKP